MAHPGKRFQDAEALPALPVKGDGRFWWRKSMSRWKLYQAKRRRARSGWILGQRCGIKTTTANGEAGASVYHRQATRMLAAKRYFRAQRLNSHRRTGLVSTPAPRPRTVTRIRRVAVFDADSGISTLKRAHDARDWRPIPPDVANQKQHHRKLQPLRQ